MSFVGGTEVARSLLPTDNDLRVLALEPQDELIGEQHVAKLGDPVLRPRGVFLLCVNVGQKLFGPWGKLLSRGSDIDDSRRLRL